MITNKKTEHSTVSDISIKQNVKWPVETNVNVLIHSLYCFVLYCYNNNSCSSSSSSSISLYTCISSKLTV